MTGERKPLPYFEREIQKAWRKDAEMSEDRLRAWAKGSLTSSNESAPWTRTAEEIDMAPKESILEWIRLKEVWEELEGLKELTAWRLKDWVRRELPKLNEGAPRAWTIEEVNGASKESILDWLLKGSCDAPKPSADLKMERAEEKIRSWSAIPYWSGELPSAVASSGMGAFRTMRDSPARREMRRSLALLKIARWACAHGKNNLGALLLEKLRGYRDELERICIALFMEAEPVAGLVDRRDALAVELLEMTSLFAPLYWMQELNEVLDGSPRDQSWVGAIVGDIAGSRFEFDNIKSKEFSLLVWPCEERRHCHFTDDSVMTLAVADALLKWRKEKSGDYEELSRLTIECMRELGRRYPRAGYGESFRNWLADDDPKPYNSWGNGAAMRVSACGWEAQSVEEAVALSNAVTRVTHNHPEGMKGAAATAVCVYLARTGKSKDEIRQHIEKHYYPLDFTIDGIRSSYDYDVSCQGTVPPALEAFLESDSFEDAIRNAISIGGDSDTIAAITGAVAGAFYGISGEIRHRAMGFLDSYLFDMVSRFEKAMLWRRSKNGESPSGWRRS